MNKADSERLDAILTNGGWCQTTSEGQADLMVVVACSVRQSAIDRIYGKAHQWQRRRKVGQLKTVLTGCVLAPDKKKMQALFDVLIDISEINNLPRLLGLNVANHEITDYLCLPARHTSFFQAYVPIANGCNNFCSYCAVPYTRGREKSRSAISIIKECRNLVKQGYKEITLLGQNVNSYQSGSYDFPKLLKAVDKIVGDYRLTFMTSHPKDLSDDLIKVMANGDHITPYLHLALQSGDRDILKKMNRHYTPEHFSGLIAKAKRAIPNLTVSTDVIVGFPSETKKQFNVTASLMRRLKFDMAYIVKFSPRPLTAAAKMKDNVPLEEKRRREKNLTAILKKTALANNKKYLNQTVRVLVEGFSKDKCLGKTATLKTVIFTGDKKLIGKFFEVKIKKVDSWGLFG